MKKYFSPKIEISILQTDIITESGGDDLGSWRDDWANVESMEEGI